MLNQNYSQAIFPNSIIKIFKNVEKIGKKGKVKSKKNTLSFEDYIRIK